MLIISTESLILISYLESYDVVNFELPDLRTLEVVKQYLDKEGST